MEKRCLKENNLRKKILVPASVFHSIIVASHTCAVVHNSLNIEGTK